MARRRRRRSRLAAGAAAVVAGLVLTACSQSGAGPGPSTATVPPATGNGGKGLVWILSARVLGLLSQDPTARAVLGRGLVYELVAGAVLPSTPLPVLPTLYVTNAASFESQVASRSFPSYVKAILFDYEHWASTPPAEQHDPTLYVAQVAQIARRHDWKLLVSPSISLAAAVSGPGGGGTSGYLDRHLAGQGASLADVLDVQAQSLERGASGYAAFVRAAVAQARAANPAVVVLAGLSTNPTGAPVTAGELESSAAAVAGLVDGYWINIPVPGSACPGCGQPRPALALDLLDWMAAQPS